MNKWKGEREGSQNIFSNFTENCSGGFRAEAEMGVLSELRETSGIWKVERELQGNWKLYILQ